ncbi:hypothetical protein EV401DRAFT_1991095 [Pisolithus croceorrhizus]|nr:hypothetical protein EV401DRAFT_1991095 [Pisolithus croceorrhizus]
MGHVTWLFIMGTDHRTFRPSAATTSPTGSSVRYKTNSLAGSLVSKSSIPYSRKSTVMSIENHCLHADIPNRRTYTLTDAIPIPPEAHKQPTQKQFTDCWLSSCLYSAPNGREDFEPIGCGTAPEHFQNMQIIKTSTHEYNDTCYMLDSHDDGMLEHHCGPTSTPDILEGTVQGTLPPSSRVNKYDCCPSIRCLCTGPGGGECLQLINCSVVPDHLKDAHGIINLARGHPLDCTWRDCGCRVTRHNFVRHIRECHLQHNRNATHKNAIRYTHGEGEPGRCMGAT